MSIAVEFTLPPDEFILAWTVQRLPDVKIEIERMVFDSFQEVTPYFWVTCRDFDRFEDLLADDPTVADFEVLDEANDDRLYRAKWRENVRGLLLALSDEVATILKATWLESEWEIRIMFADHESLSNFHHYCETYNVPLELRRLKDSSDLLAYGAYGVTAKQRETLLTALDEGYFEVPRECSLAELADELGISENAASVRLRRGYENLVEHALARGTG